MACLLITFRSNLALTLSDQWSAAGCLRCFLMKDLSAYVWVRIWLAVLIHTSLVLRQVSVVGGYSVLRLTREFSNVIPGVPKSVSVLS